MYIICVMYVLPFYHKGGCELAFFENGAKKRHVGRKIVHLYTLYCTEVKSLCAPLEIEEHSDGDHKEEPAPAVVKLEGSEPVKEGGIVQAGTTMAPDHPAGLSGNDYVECGY